MSGQRSQEAVFRRRFLRQSIDTSHNNNRVGTQKSDANDDEPGKLRVLDYYRSDKCID